MYSSGFFFLFVKVVSSIISYVQLFVDPATVMYSVAVFQIVENSTLASCLQHS
jgi:hypothetical protein